MTGKTTVSGPDRIAARTITPGGPCPYCRSIPGVGASAAVRRSSVFDVVLASDDDWVLVPTVGMFLPGYLLLVTRNHLPSLAHLEPTRLAALEQAIAHLTESLAPVFGEYLLFEHGVTAGFDRTKGTCVDHAHLHLIPAGRVAERVASRLGGPAELAVLSELRPYADRGYALLRRPLGWWVWAEPHLASQWIRRTTASLLGIEHWDWAVYKGERELELTLDRIGGSLG